MSHRKSAHAAYRESVPKLESPASYVPEVSADVRVFWPPNATRAHVHSILLKTLRDVQRQIDTGEFWE